MGLWPPAIDGHGGPDPGVRGSDGVTSPKSCCTVGLPVGDGDVLFHSALACDLRRWVSQPECARNDAQDDMYDVPPLNKPFPADTPQNRP